MTVRLNAPRSVHQRRVDSFMEKAGQDVPDKPCVPDEKVRLLRAKFFIEEPFETIDALGFEPVIMIDGVEHVLTSDNIGFRAHGRGCDIVGVVDGCCDTNVISTGSLTAFGVADDWVQRAIDESNLAKFGPGGHRRDDGKWIKPADWKAPDLMSLLVKQGYEPEQVAAPDGDTG